jgi:hypothetical protein
MRFAAVSLLAALLLTGCVSTTYVQTPVADPDDAIVYFIRQSAQPYAWKVQVFLDDQKVASIANRSYVAFHYPAGEHTLHAEWPPLAGMVEADGSVALETAGTHYFVIAARVGMTDEEGEEVRPATMDITEVSPEEGEAILRKLGY